MAGNHVDVSNDDDLGSISVVASGTVTNDVRVIYDDAANLSDVIVALDVAKAKIVEVLE